MRRGLMDWNSQEVPAGLLAARVAEVARECHERDLDVLVLFANFTRPAAISALTHFVPFWSQALLGVTRSGRTVLAMAPTGRTVQWIRSTACVDEVLVGSDVGTALGGFLARECGGSAIRVGLACPQDMPQAVLDSLFATLSQGARVDATEWWRPLAANFGPTPVVAQGANDMVLAGMQAVAGRPHAHAHALVACLDSLCRSMGAEEVQVLVAPDLDQSAGLQRLEGMITLGRRIAVQLTLAYKGHWLRMTRSFERTGENFIEHPGSSRAAEVLAQAGRDARSPGEAAQAVAKATGSELADWWLESSVQGLGLNCIAAPDHVNGHQSLPTHGSLTLQLHDARGPWLLGQAIH